MGYFEITGKVEEVDESSYTRKGADGTEEMVSKVQLALVVPGMQDRVRCELPLELAPKSETLEKWEMDGCGWWSRPTACARWPSPAATRGQERRQWARW
jgi:hypothetical protein